MGKVPASEAQLNQHGGHRPPALWLRNHLWHKEPAVELGPHSPVTNTVSAISDRPEVKRGERIGAFHLGQKEVWAGTGEHWAPFHPQQALDQATWECPTPSFPTRPFDMSHRYRNKLSCTAANATSTFRSPRWEMFRILFCTAEQVRDERLGGWVGQMEQEALDKGPC